MESKIETEAKKIRCPYYPWCSEQFHPAGTKFCPNTGKQILPEKRVTLHLIFHVSLSLLVIILGAAIILIQSNSRDSKPPSPDQPPDIFRRGEKILLEYETNTKGEQLVPDMAEAYLEKKGASGIAKIRKSDKEVIIKGDIPYGDKSIKAEISCLHGSSEPPVSIKINKKKEQENIFEQLEREKRKRQEEKEKRNRIEEKCYKAYLNLANKYREDGEWNEALDTVEKAKEIKHTRAVISLREKILREKRETGNGKTVDFLRLPPETKNQYNLKMEKIGSISLQKETKVTGELNLALSVNKDGSITVQRFIHEYLSVSPESQMDEIKKVISEEIKKISLAQPRDKGGTPVKVVNWLLRFKVATFKGDVILKIIK
jgi:hypothetical protein